MSHQEHRRALHRQVAQFAEKHGFFLIVLVCVAVITVSAMLSGRTTLTQTVPTPPAGDAQAAAQLLQQSLADAIQPTPSPTPAPFAWQAPVRRVQVLRAFSDALSYSPQTRLWSVHDAADLAAEMGEIVYPIGPGTVTDTGETGVDGAFVRIDHGSGVIALYACLHRTAGLRPGDPVSPDQAIGFAGGGKLDETDLAPHVHLRVTRDGSAIDPLTLFAP